MKGPGQTLLGLDWLKHLTLDWQNIFSVFETKEVENSTVSISEVLSEFKEVFEESLGTVKNAKARLALKPDATPKFLASRPIPYALKTSVEKEIKTRVRKGMGKSDIFRMGYTSGSNSKE